MAATFGDCGGGGDRDLARPGRVQLIGGISVFQAPQRQSFEVL